MVTIQNFQNKYAVVHDGVLVKVFRTRVEAQEFIAEYQQGL